MKLLKNKLYKEKDKGFYVHAKTEIKSVKVAAKYVGRYVGCPAIAGVDPCKCPNCGNKIRFHDIVYPKYGSMREQLRIKIISENEEKLEEALQNYAITKRILSGKIISKTT